jgi:hypothetical protein
MMALGASDSDAARGREGGLSHFVTRRPGWRRARAPGAGPSAAGESSIQWHAGVPVAAEWPGHPHAGVNRVISLNDIMQSSSSSPAAGPGRGPARTLLESSVRGPAAETSESRSR